MNRQRKVVITVTYNGLGMIVDTKAEELDLSAQPNLQPNLQPTCNNLATDCISRQSAIDNLKRHRNETDVPDSYPGIFNAIEEWLSDWKAPSAKPDSKELSSTRKTLDNDSPSAQLEPLSDTYMNAVWTWLLDYQIKAAELKGRYTPYEVLSWVANDWRKEHEGSD